MVVPCALRDWPLRAVGFLWDSDNESHWQKIGGGRGKRLEYLLPCVLLGYSLAMGVSLDENHSSNGRPWPLRTTALYNSDSSLFPCPSGVVEVKMFTVVGPRVLHCPLRVSLSAQAFIDSLLFRLHPFVWTISFMLGSWFSRTTLFSFSIQKIYTI